LIPLGDIEMSQFNIALNANNNSSYNALTSRGNFPDFIQAVQVKGLQARPPTFGELGHGILYQDNIQDYLYSLWKKYAASMKNEPSPADHLSKGFLDYMHQTKGWDFTNYVKEYPENYYVPAKSGDVDISETPRRGAPYGTIYTLASFICEKHGSRRPGSPQAISPTEGQIYRENGLGQFLRVEANTSAKANNIPDSEDHDLDQ
jgi:hypothetical protein